MKIFFFNFLFFDREEEFLMHLEIAAQIIYLLILIVVLIFGLRKCKRDSRPKFIGGGQGQTPVSLSFTSDDGDDTSSGQIAMGPTSLVVNATMAF